MGIHGSSPAMAVPPGRAMKVWFHPEVIPLYAAIGAGVGLCTTFGLRHLLACPDVYVNKKKRVSRDIEKNDTSSGVEWANHRFHNLTRHEFNSVGLLHWHPIEYQKTKFLDSSPPIIKSHPQSCGGKGT